MTFLGSRAVEEELLGTRMAGASSDLLGASQIALTYCAQLGMGSSLLVVPANGPLSYPMPVARMAESLLEMLMVETKRLIREKEYAVHAVATALIEKGELIGPELEQVFDEADAKAGEKAKPFVRKVIALPRLFEEPEQAAGGANDGWPAQPATASAAAAEPAAHGQPSGWGPLPGDWF